MIRFRILIKLQNIAILIGLAMFFSCKPDLEAIQTVTQQVNTPLESAFDVRILYSTHGRVQTIMEAPQMDRYHTAEPYLELPKGFVLIFFDSLMNETSRISANYAIQYEQKNLVEARNNVEVINEQNQKLNTEQLFWDRNRKLIYSDKFVKITTEDEILLGDGFESDERFEKWMIKKTRGTFNIETPQESQQEPAFSPQQ